MLSLISAGNLEVRESYVVSKSDLILLPQCIFTPKTFLYSQVDFSRNAIRRLNVDVLEGLEPHLLELHLDHNLLGNNYNPSFSFTEVAKLTALQVRNKGSTQGISKYFAKYS